MPSPNASRCGGTGATPEAREYADLLERVGIALGDVLEQLDQLGMRYATSYARTFYALPSPRRRVLLRRELDPARPAAMDARAATLIREIVLDELRKTRSTVEEES